MLKQRVKERKISGEERNTRKKCPRHKTATMIAYGFPLPNNRRQRPRPRYVCQQTFNAFTSLFKK
jgi:hypothetical protein